jgi:Ca2+-binding EF-hand superfamily protein
VRIFEQTDSDRSGYIDAAELGRVLSTDGYTPFSPRTVRLILHLFAENQTDPTRVGKFDPNIVPYLPPACKQSSCLHKTLS